MHIPEHLPQFESHRALLVVASKQTAQLYRAHDREIAAAASCTVDTPHFSDNEGFSTYGGRKNKPGSMSGFVREIRDEQIIAPFIKQLCETLDRMISTARVDEIYLFVPQQMRRQIKHALTHPVSAKIKKIIAGNFVKFSPIELLEKL